MSSKIPKMAITKHAYWIPVRLTTTGFIRIEAYSPEDAMEMAESGNFNVDEGIGLEIESHEVVGPPLLETTS